MGLKLKLQMKVNEEYQAPNGEGLEGALEDAVGSPFTVHRSARECSEGRR